MTDRPLSLFGRRSQFRHSAQHPTCAGKGQEMPQADFVRDWIFHFGKPQRLPDKESDHKHRADAGEQERACGAQNANSSRLNRYGFLTSVAV